MSNMTEYEHFSFYDYIEEGEFVCMYANRII